MDDESTELQLDFGGEIAAFLADNENDIAALLRDEGVNVTSGRKASPSPGSKEFATILIAGTAAIVATASALTKVLTVIFNRRRILKNNAWAPLLGPDGQPIRDAAGRPMLQVVTTYSVLEPGKLTMSEAFEASSPVLTVRYQSSQVPTEPIGPAIAHTGKE